MIIFDKADKAFMLNGKNFSYAMFIGDAGYLQSLYYGGKISDGDVRYLIGHVGKTVMPRPDDFNVDGMLDGMPAECGAYAHGDYREPTVVIERADGAAMSRLIYRSHRIYDGVPEIAGMPHARSGGQTLEITLGDEFSDVAIALSYTVWDDGDVLVRNIKIVNNGKTPVRIKKAFSFCLSLPNDGFKLLRLHGSWAGERKPESERLAHGVTRIQSLRGASSHQMNPFTALIAENCDERHGDCYGFMPIYSGSFALTAELSADDTVRVQGGINDIGFCWELCGGESFTSPQAALCYSADGLGGMSRAYADFLRDRIIAPRFVRARRPIVVNNWEATYFDFDEKKLFDIIDAAAPLGIDTFVLDDGWFGARSDEKRGLGDWTVNDKKLKGGLAAIADRCKKRGMKLGLWFEPEMVNEDSDLYRAHPDYALKKDGVTPVRMRNQLVLDMTRPEVVDFAFNAVHNVLAQNDISYVKWDMNRTLTELYSAALPPSRQGEVMHRYMLGVYALAERLTAAYPDVFFEGCAGGGGRFDAGMLYYFAQIWTSDDTDAHERTKIQWGTSLCYPPSTMSCHVSVCPNHQTQRTTPLSTRAAVAMLGAFGYELDVAKLGEAEKAEIKKQTEQYKRVDELVLNGDLYRLCDPFAGNYFAEMMVSKDKTRAFVVIERHCGDPCDHNRLVRLDGLDENKTYNIEELGVTATGRALMRSGVLLPRLPDYGSAVWHVQAADGRQARCGRISK